MNNVVGQRFLRLTVLKWAGHSLATFALAIGLLAMWVIEAHDGGEE